MSRIAEMLRSRRMPQVAVLTLMSVGFAGCSADMQTRFSDSSFSNPFASQPDFTASVRAPAVERSELPQYARPPNSKSAIPVPGLAAACSCCAARHAAEMTERPRSTPGTRPGGFSCSEKAGNARLSRASRHVSTPNGSHMTPIWSSCSPPGYTIIDKIARLGRMLAKMGSLSH